MDSVDTLDTVLAPLFLEDDSIVTKDFDITADFASGNVFEESRHDEGLAILDENPIPNFSVLPSRNSNSLPVPPMSLADSGFLLDDNPLTGDFLQLENPPLDPEVELIDVSSSCDDIGDGASLMELDHDTSEPSSTSSASPSSPPSPTNLPNKPVARNPSPSTSTRKRKLSDLGEKFVPEQKNGKKKRRVSSGESHQAMTAEEIEEQLSRPGLTASEVDHLRKQLRLAKNRESAHLSRLRKKGYVEDLESRLRDMSEENERLRDEKEFLAAENIQLKQQVVYLKGVIEHGGLSGALSRVRTSPLSSSLFPCPDSLIMIGS